MEGRRNKKKKEGQKGRRNSGGKEERKGKKKSSAGFKPVRLVLLVFLSSDLSMSSIFGLRSSYMLEYRWLFALLLRSARYFTGIEGKWTLLPPISPPSSHSLFLLFAVLDAWGSRCCYGVVQPPTGSSLSGECSLPQPCSSPLLGTLPSS